MKPSLLAPAGSFRRRHTSKRIEDEDTMEQLCTDYTTGHAKTSHGVVIIVYLSKSYIR